jgi:hypothetical protein
VSRVPGTLQDEVDAIRAEPRGHPRQLGAQANVHSEAAFPLA